MNRIMTHNHLINKMRLIKRILGDVISSIIVLVVLLSCNAKVEETDVIEATQEIRLEASALTVQISIYELDKAITEIQNTADWLTVVQDLYSSGTPQVKVSCTENNEPSERVAIVVVKTKAGDKVTLTVIQKAKTEIEDIHNTPSDQPPFVQTR